MSDTSPLRATGVAARSLHLPGTSGFRRLNLAMLMAGLAAFGVLYATQPLLPSIGADFGVGPSIASLSVSASTGALALAVLPSAAVALRIGRVRTMRIGLILATALTALAAAAPTFTVLVLARALAGVVLAGVVAVAMGHVGAEVHPSGLGSAMGLYIAGNSLGGVSGRLLSSVVADGTSWRWGVGAVAGGALVVTALFWLLIPEPVAVLPSAEQRAHAYRDLVSRPVVVALLLVPFLLMGGFVGVYNYLDYRLLAPPFSLPLALVGLVFLAYLAGGAASAVAGMLADRLGRPPVLVAAMVVMAVGLGLTVPDDLVLVISGLIILTAGFFGAHATASGWTPVLASPHGTQGSGLYVCAYYAGSSIFGAVLGLAWSGSGWSGVVVSVGVLIGVALMATAYVVVHRPRASPAP